MTESMESVAEGSMMVTPNVRPDVAPVADAKQIAGRFNRTAYVAALRHTPDRPFTDLELALRHELPAACEACGGLGRDAV